MGAALREFYNSLLSKMIVVPDQQDRLWVEVTVLAAGRDTPLLELVSDLKLSGIPDIRRMPDDDERRRVIGAGANLIDAAENPLRLLERNMSPKEGAVEV